MIGGECRESVIPDWEKASRVRFTTGRAVLPALAAVLFGAAVATGAVVVDGATHTRQTPLESAVLGVKIAVLVVPAMVLLVVGWRADLPAYRPVLEWSGLVGVSVAATAAVTSVSMDGETTLSLLSVTVSAFTGLNVGCLLGALIGMHAVDAAENTRIANERRDDFVFLNRLLRHHLLNAVTIIRGRAELMEDEVPEAAETHVRAIRQRSDHIASLVETVGTISNALSENTETTPVDITTVVADVASTYRLESPNATIEVDAPELAYAASNGSLHVVFDHLIENALEHNDTGSPFVRLTVTEGADDVTVRVLDNGPGFPDSIRETAFEPGEAGDSALGLYAVGVIVDDCDGSVDLMDTDGRTEVVVTLPRATPAS